MKLNSYLSLLLILATTFILACGSDEQPTAVVGVEKSAKPLNPFKFYKNIEIRPGLNFEVLSWGKGADTLGGYSIFLSDSLRNNYRSIALERKGIITDAWNMDLDTDGNPELYIQFLRNKVESDLVVYEFDDNDFRKISFPSLSAKTRKLYLGNDKFYVKNGSLYRSIPVKNESDTAKKTTEVMTVNYDLRGNSFLIK
ncbi:MAG: hypothetical protein EOP48_28170 [Sphingobacteriales bacterium]|nr:MAG: hypothetical protein EOP48_28170 [Sphingobacteriales bacterium]